MAVAGEVAVIKIKEGEMGSYAKRALETKMSVMVQVFKLESQLGFVLGLGNGYP